MEYKKGGRKKKEGKNADDEECKRLLNSPLGRVPHNIHSSFRIFRNPA